MRSLQELREEMPLSGEERRAKNRIRRELLRSPGTGNNFKTAKFTIRGTSSMVQHKWESK